MPVFLIVLGALICLAGLMIAMGMLLGFPFTAPVFVAFLIFLLGGAGLIILGAAKQKKRKELILGIIGYWKDKRGSISEFRRDGTWMLDGSIYLYRSYGGRLKILSRDGIIKATCRLIGDTLYTTIGGSTNEWQRMPGNTVPTFNEQLRPAYGYEKDIGGIMQSVPVQTAPIAVSAEPACVPPLSAPVSKGYSVYYGSGYCDVCNKNIIPGEAYKVPVNVFYSSARYKQHISVLALALGMTADQMINQMRSKDTTTYSAVCKDCIHLFE